MPPGDVAPLLITMVVTVSLAAVVILRGPLGRALSRRLEGQSADPALREELDDLRSRLAETEVLAERVAELEERVDFSERLLIKQQPREVNRMRTPV